MQVATTPPRGLHLSTNSISLLSSPASSLSSTRYWFGRDTSFASTMWHLLRAAREKEESAVPGEDGDEYL